MRAETIRKKMQKTVLKQGVQITTSPVEFLLAYDRDNIW